LKKTIMFTLALALMCWTAGETSAQVKRVQMHIAGYLCGN